MEMERRLEMIDFSRFSRVRADLKERLMQQVNGEMSMEELDYVAAAADGRKHDKEIHNK